MSSEETSSFGFGFGAGFWQLIYLHDLDARLFPLGLNYKTREDSIVRITPHHIIRLVLTVVGTSGYVGVAQNICWTLYLNHDGWTLRRAYASLLRQVEVMRRS